MTRKSANQNHKPDDPEQSKRFEAAARELEADESGSTFERVMKAVMPPKTLSARPKKPKT